MPHIPICSGSSISLEIFNVNVSGKHIRLNDQLSSLLTFNDERFVFLTCIVYWLEAWQSLPEKGGKLSKHTFTSFKYPCFALPEITNFLTELSLFLSLNIFLTDRSVGTSFWFIWYDVRCKLSHSYLQIL